MMKSDTKSVIRYWMERFGGELLSKLHREPHFIEMADVDRSYIQNSDFNASVMNFADGLGVVSAWEKQLSRTSPKTTLRSRFQHSE